MAQESTGFNFRVSANLLRLIGQELVASDDAAVSKQVTAHLLCRDCEHRINVNGEKWVLKNCWRKEGFPLASMLASAKPEEVPAQVLPATLVSVAEQKGDFPRVKIFHAAKIPGIDLSALAYFPASILWRTSIHNWKPFSRADPIKLGPYEEEMRKYLMGITAFPRNAALWVTVPSGEFWAGGFMMEPFRIRLGDCFAYRLLFLGIVFHLILHKRPQEFQQQCLVRGAGNPIMATSHFNEWIMQDASRVFGREPDQW